MAPAPAPILSCKASVASAWRLLPDHDFLREPDFTGSEFRELLVRPRP